MTKEAKYQFVRDLAALLVSNKMTMPAKQLAELLNHNQIHTTYDTAYEGGRGTYTLIHSIYDWAEKNHGDQAADCVARAFTKEDGTYAYQ